MAPPTTASEPLWVERYGEASGLSSATARVLDVEDGGRYGPYLFVALAWAVTTLGFGFVRFLQDGTFPVLQAPGLLVAILPLLFVVYVILGLRDRYRAVVEDLPDPVDVSESEDARIARAVLRVAGWSDPTGADALADIVTRRVKLSVLVLGLGLQASWFVLDPSPTSHLAAVYGRPVALVYFLLIVPLVYTVLGAELLSLYLGVHLFLPLKATAADRIDFDDPLRFGGLRPLGRLLRDSTASFLVVLAFFVVSEAVGPGSSPLDAFSRLLLLGGTAFAACAFAAPVYWLHKHMRGMKEARVERISRAMVEGGPDGGPATDALPDPGDVDYTYEFIRLTRVENMHEFPVDLSLVLEFCVALLLPYAADVSTALVSEALLG